MTNEEYIKLFHQTGVNLVAFKPVFHCYDELRKMVEIAIEKERASNHAYIYELERDLEVAQDKIKGCLGILNYNPRGQE